MSTVDDPEVQEVATFIQAADPAGTRFARVFRETIDQLYDGQRTGRYRWDQLLKTEKTHYGTLVEINLQREFQFDDGKTMDFLINGVEVDCKYSQTHGSWMIPPEAIGHLCLLTWAEDSSDPKWSVGLVRVTNEILTLGGNRDRKRSISKAGRESIYWLWDHHPLPGNVLLEADQSVVAQIFQPKSGTERINRLFRLIQERIISRNVVATVNQGKDYMKRVRGNGGARTFLKTEGILILGQFQSHVKVAHALGLPEPKDGDSISVRVVPANGPGPGIANIAGKFWRKAHPTDPVVQAPDLPVK